MKNETTRIKDLENINVKMITIIDINDSDAQAVDDEDLLDFDCDYDPNEMYYALLDKD
jgi:hypothetical protein